MNWDDGMGPEYQKRSRTNGQSENGWQQAMLDPEQRLGCWPLAVRQLGPEKGGRNFPEKKRIYYKTRETQRKR